MLCRNPLSQPRRTPAMKSSNGVLSSPLFFSFFSRAARCSVTAAGFLLVIERYLPVRKEFKLLGFWQGAFSSLDVTASFICCCAVRLLLAECLLT